LWRFRDAGAVYKCHDLLTFLSFNFQLATLLSMFTNVFDYFYNLYKRFLNFDLNVSNNEAYVKI